MSWKNIVCAGLLCVIASPVLAQPTLSVDLVRDGGGLAVLDSNGDWQWRISIEGDGAGTLGAELAFMLTDAGLVGATASNAADWDLDNPGTDPDGIFGDFSWLVDNGDGNPEGLQSDVTADEVFAALGSIEFLAQTDSELIIVTTEGPSTAGSLTTSIEWGGAYAGNGRVAQSSGNTDTYAGSISKTVIGGDANLNGNVTIADFGILQPNVNQAGVFNWDDGDFNGTKTVTIADFGILQPNIDMMGPAPGGGSLSAGGVPEPATVVLVGLALVGLTGYVRRRK